MDVNDLPTWREERVSDVGTQAAGHPGFAKQGEDLYFPTWRVHTLLPINPGGRRILNWVMQCML